MVTGLATNRKFTYLRGFGLTCLNRLSEARRNCESGDEFGRSFAWMFVDAEATEISYR